MRVLVIHCTASGRLPALTEDAKQSVIDLCPSITSYQHGMKWNKRWNGGWNGRWNEY